MKYKNQLIIGSSILVILLAVFIGVRLTESSNESNTIAKVDREIDNIADDGILDQDKVDEKVTDTEEKDTLDQNEGTENEEKKTTDEKQDISKVEDEDKLNPTDKTTEEKTDEDATTNDKVNEKKVDETDKIKDEEDKTTSKSVDEDGKTPEEPKQDDKEQSSKDDKVVYVFKNKYIVQSKETLSDIVKKCLMANKLELTNSIYFEHAKNLITKINNIADPNLIITGTKMIIPTKANFKGLLPDGEAYMVKDGDTIHEIVLNQMTWCEYFKAKDMLMKNNGIENEIRAGITIYIPTEDSEV